MAEAAVGAPPRPLKRVIVPESSHRR
jgi:hypothetical protein